MSGTMSAYYSNLLPPNLPNGTTPDNLGSQHDMKYEAQANFYGSQQSGAAYDGDNPLGFPRFPPYDRLDIRPITSAAKGGYTGGQAYPSSGMGYPPHNGQYTEEMAAQMKLHGAADGMVPSHGAASQPGMMPGYPGSNMPPMNGGQSQNIPIYPWMRPMNGGKAFALFTFALIEDLCTKIKYQGHGQVITSHRYCGM